MEVPGARERLSLAVRLLEAHRGVATLLGERQSAESLPGVLQLLCRSLAWDVGALWQSRAGEDHMGCRVTWSDDPGAARAFLAMSRRFRLGRGEGLPGRVWAGSRPVVIPEIANDAALPRQRELLRLGFVTACGFPLTHGARFLGAIELFRAASRPVAPQELEYLAALGAQLGQHLALMEAEDRFQAVAGTTGDAIVLADGDGRILGWNVGAERIFGHTARAAVGQPLTMLMPEHLRAAHEAGIARLTAGEEPRLLGRTLELTGLRADGAEFPVELTLASWANAGEVFYSAIVRDVTERHQAEARLRAREAEEAVLRRIATAVAADWTRESDDRTPRHLGHDRPRDRRAAAARRGSHRPLRRGPG